MTMDLFYIAAGLGILLFSGDMLVRGAVSIARRFNVPPMLVGLTIVAFGTSAPELVIGINAAFVGGEATGLALGNVVGSNIANVLLVLGLPALICPTCCKQPTIRRNTMIMVGATLVFIALCLNMNLEISRFEGLFLVVLLAAFLGYSAMRARTGTGDGIAAELTEELEEMTGLPERIWMIALFIGVAAIGLPSGSHLIVTGAVSLAEDAGVAPSVIGLSLIAVGTSLPELATTVVAALHRHSGVALGNVIGSNMFNLLGIMGLTALVAPEAISVEPRFASIDLWVMLAATVILVPYTWRHLTIGRFSGLGFLAAYSVFIFVLFDQEQQVRDGLQDAGMPESGALPSAGLAAASAP